MKQKVFPQAFAVLLISGMTVGPLLSSEGPTELLYLCEEAIHDVLLAPSTYQQIAVSYLDERSVYIEYDSDNEYGVPVRGRVTCEAPPLEAAVTRFSLRINGGPYMKWLHENRYN
jgi:hypothetical protein